MIMSELEEAAEEANLSGVIDVVQRDTRNLLPERESRSASPELQPKIRQRLDDRDETIMIHPRERAVLLPLALR